jgi:hypothetical protein
LARASNALQRPSGDSMEARLNEMVTSGVRIAFTPPARAASHSPCRSAVQARSSATSDEEQAVSTARLGPRRSNRCDSRLAVMLNAPPEAECTSIWRRPNCWMA